jgi:hypothetical protein
MNLHFSICYWSGDWPNVAPLVNQIKALFPQATIAFVPDGRSPLAQTGNSHLKSKDGGAWIERILNTCPRNCDLFFKVEPDITFKRLPTHWPDADWFGHWSKPVGAKHPLLRGGFWGFRPVAVERILQSWLLQDECYLADRYKYDRYGRFLLPGEVPGPPVYHCDSIMASVCDRVGIGPTPWSEVYLNFREPVPENIEDYAIVTCSG